MSAVTLLSNVVPESLMVDPSMSVTVDVGSSAAYDPSSSSNVDPESLTVDPSMSVTADASSSAADDTSTVNTLRSRRRRNPPKRFSSSWFMSPTAKVYCICRQAWQNKPMIQCDYCLKWYHCTCVNLPDTLCCEYAENDITYHCGFDMCNSGVSFCSIRGNVSSVKSPVSLPLQPIMLRTDNISQTSADDSLTCDMSMSHTALTVTSELDHTTAVNDHSSPVIENNTIDHNYCGTPKNSVDVPASRVYDTLSRATVESVFSCDVPQSDYFEGDVCDLFTFTIPCTVFDNLLVPGKRRFAEGMWESVFVQGFKEYNDKCVLKFKRHYVPAGRSDKTFYANGCCTVPGCPFTFRICMFDKTKVHVHNTGKIRHPLFGRWSRPVRKLERANMKSVFRKGTKPYTVYMDTISTKSTQSLIAGNYDGLGRTSSVMQRIASESRQVGRLDEDVFHSLLKLKNSFIHDFPRNTCVPGFIQLVSMDPVMVHFWSENGIRLWHDLCPVSAVFLDATGSVVRDIMGSKKLLYYEVSCRNSNGGSPAVPLAAMLSASQSVTAITNFLQNFRQSERQVYGFRGLSVPCVITVDFSMALITSVLNVFSGFTLSQYFLWCWKILSGQATCRDFCCFKTVLHVCLAHFMHRVKVNFCKVLKGALDLVLYGVSLIANADTLSEVREVVYDLCLILGSKYQTENFVVSFNNLHKKIDCMSIADVPITSDDTDSDDAVTDANNDDVFDFLANNGNEAGPSLNGQTDRCAESEYLTQSPLSPFTAWSQEVHSVACSAMGVGVHEHCDQILHNRYYFPDVLKKILKLYMPTLPLWSTLMLGDVRRHSSLYSNIKVQHMFHHNKALSLIPPRTTGSQERRFGILKSLVLQGQKASRMDDFAVILKEHFCAVEKDYTATYCRKRQTRQSTAASSTATQPLEEEWAKRQKRSASHKKTTLLGKYQQQPTYSLRNLNNIAPRSVSVEDGRTTKHLQSSVSETATSFTLCNMQKSTVTTEVISVALRDFCPINNFCNNCWLNCVVQAFCKTLSVTEVCQSYVVDCDSDTHTTRLHNCLVNDVFRHMRLTAPSPVPDSFVWKMLTLYDLAFGSDTPVAAEGSDVCSSFMSIPSAHRDAHKALTNVIGSLFNKCDLLMTIKQIKVCRNCGTSVADDECMSVDSVMLHVPHSTKLQSTISLSFLMQNFLGDVPVTEFSNSCGCRKPAVVKRTQITSLPPTVVFMFERAIVSESGQTVKNERKVELNSVLKIPLIDSRRNITAEFMYRLSSYICHYGNSTGSGHYVANVVNTCDNGFVVVVCNDLSVKARHVTPSLVLDANSKRNVYIAVYDHFCVVDNRVKQVLLLLKSSSGIRYLAENYFLKEDSFARRLVIARQITNCYDIGRLLSEISFTMTIPQNLTTASLITFLQCLFAYLTGLQQPMCNELSVTANLHRSSRSADSPRTFTFPGVLRVSDVTGPLALINYVKHNICDIVHFDSDALSPSAIIISGFPSTLVLCCDAHCDVMLQIDVSHLISRIYPNHILLYKLEGLLCVTAENSVQCYFSNFDQCIDNIKTAKATVAVYNIESKQCVQYILDNRGQECVSVDDVSLSCTVPPSANSNAVCYGSVTLTCEKLDKILRRDWFTDDIVDCYLYLLSKHCHSNVVVYPAAVFGTKFLKDQDPAKPLFDVNYTDICGDDMPWFSSSGTANCDFVIIPLSILNKHFIVLVLDMHAKTIFYCDSMRGLQHSVVNQMLRHLCFQYAVSTGMTLNVRHWRLCCYCDVDNNFPVQTDTHNCGPYVCIICKCILLKRRLRFDSVLQLRWTVYQELTGDTLR